MMKRWISLTVMCLGAVVIAPSVQAQNDLSFDMVGKTSVTTADGNVAMKDIEMRFRTMVSGDKVRFDFDMKLPVPGNPFGNGYMVSLDGGKRFIMIDPDKKEYMEADLAGLFGEASKAMAGMNMKAINPTFSLEKVGDGPELQGYPTVHHRSKESIEMSITVMGNAMVSKNETTTDYYTTTAIKSPPNPLLNGNQMALQMFGEEFTKIANEKQAKLEALGTPLRLVAVSKVTDPMGGTMTTTATFDVSNLSTKTLDASVFAIPEGFKKVDVTLPKPIKEANAEAGAAVE